MEWVSIFNIIHDGYRHRRLCAFSVPFLGLASLLEDEIGGTSAVRDKSYKQT